MTDIETHEDKLQRKYLNGLLFTLLLIPCYFSFLLALFTFEFFYSLLRCDAILTSVRLVFPLFLIIHNVFFALFTRRLWIKYYPEMSRVTINIICWGTFFVPVIFHIIAIAGLAWKKKSVWIKLLPVIMIPVHLFFIGFFLWILDQINQQMHWSNSPPPDIFPLQYLTAVKVNICFFGLFAALLLFKLCYTTIATVKPSLPAIKTCDMMIVFVVLCLSFVYVSKKWEERRWDKLSDVLAVYDAPTMQADSKKFLNNGMLTDYLNILTDTIATGKLTREEYIELDQELQKTEQIWRNSFITKIRGDFRSITKNREGYPFNSNIFSAPSSMMFLRFLISWATQYAELISALANSPLDYWQLPPVQKDATFSDSLQDTYRDIAMIRAARVAARHFAGLETDCIRDPFMDAPFEIFEGRFTVSVDAFEDGMLWPAKIFESVRGIRIISNGWKQIENPKSGYSRFLSFDVVFDSPRG